MLLATSGFDRERMVLIDELNNSNLGSTSDRDKLLEVRMMMRV
jgi:hypothetical protein